MDEAKRDLKGSAYRDAIRLWHKQALPCDYCGSDVDFVCIHYNDERVCSVLDFKDTGDKITKTQHILYEWFEDNGIPVYIIRVVGLSSKYCPECGRWDRYITGRPTFVVTRYLSNDDIVMTLEEYKKFEFNLREATK